MALGLACLVLASAWVAVIYAFLPKKWQTKTAKLDAVDQQSYIDAFTKTGGKIDKKKLRRAVKAILKIRKFEIELYWKRATYFWAFIALVYTAYGLLETSRKTDYASPLEWVVACLGLLLAVAWHLVNRGSKYWQENWENHLDILETKFLGPLYKTVIYRPPNSPFDLYHQFKSMAFGPGAYSVSKVNSTLSFVNIFIWSYLIAKLFGITLGDIDFEERVIVMVTLVVIVVMCYVTRTDEEHHTDLQAQRRKTEINNF